MKILYYCPEYYCNHGGRTHARGFFEALGNLPSVTGTFLYPDGDSLSTAQISGTNKFSRGKLWFLPYTARRIIQFFVPRRDLTKRLINEINVHGCDALVIRTGTRLPILRWIKKSCPETSICLEINAAYFDEVFGQVPLRSVFQKWEVARYAPADAVVVVSSYLKAYLQNRGLCAEKIVVNQNGVDAKAMCHTGVGGSREQYGIPKEAFLLGYIGGMEPFRRLPEVVAYIADLRGKGHKDIFLLIVGDGRDMASVQTAIEFSREVLDNGVICVGWQPHSEIPKFLAMFDLAIFPFTNAYCSPLKLFEYLGSGLPTVGPDTPAVREVFEDGVHLKLVKQDGSDFSKTILELKNDPNLRMTLGNNGKQLVLSEYTWDKNAERVVKHILRARARSKRRGK